MLLADVDEGAAAVAEALAAEGPEAAFQPTDVSARSTPSR